MRVLLAGDWHSELHEEGVDRALVQLGHEVIRFPWQGYFRPNGEGTLAVAWKKIQNKYLFGPLVSRLNRDLLALATETRPELVFIYRGTHVLPETLRALKKRLPETVLVGYNNDDPFAPQYPRWLWRHFLGGLPEYDLALAYRLHNLEDFRVAGAKRVELLRSWFIPERNHPVELSSDELAQYGCDVVFVGHYEADGRVELLEEIVRWGWKLHIYGPGYDWDPVIRDSPDLKNQVPVRLVWGDEYNKAICGAKVALCFLSKLNRDTYTRRCFEIPATGVLMLAERTEDLTRLFQPGEEADFFGSKDEMIEKLGLHLSDDELRGRIAMAGMSRVFLDGHDVVSRMRQVMSWTESIREEERV